MNNNEIMNNEVVEATEEVMLKVPNWLALPLVLRRTSLKRSKSMALR